MSWAAEYGPIPDDYVALDVESSGIDTHRDLPLQLGWCVVKNRKAVLEADVLIDWTRTLSPAAVAELDARMTATRGRMAEKDKAYPWTLDMLRARGVSPVDAVDRLIAVLGPDPAVAAHYGFLFDYPCLGRTFELVGREFAPDLDRMLDTGLMIRACLVGVSPAWNETLPVYVKRLNAVRCGPRHNLAAAAEFFDLRAASGVASKNCHTASYDAWIVHLLIEKLRGLVRPAVRAGTGGPDRG